MPKIVHEIKKCIGCGSCASVCPKYWEMGNDGKAHLKNSPSVKEGREELEVDQIDCNRSAADVCPVQCIHIKK